MSWKATAYVKEIVVCPDGRRITVSEKLLCFILADYHRIDENLAWPSLPRLARESLLSERQARRCLQSLETKKVIRIEKGLGRGNISTYSFPALDVAEQIKGDTMAPFSEIKGDMEGREKGTSGALKGDISGSVKKNRMNRDELVKRFAPPEVAQVIAYMKSQEFQNAAATAQKFIDYYEMRGWIPGGQRTQMKSWKAAVRTWKGNEQKFNGNGGARNGRYQGRLQGAELEDENKRACAEALRRAEERDSEGTLWDGDSGGGEGGI